MSDTKPTDGSSVNADANKNEVFKSQVAERLDFLQKCKRLALLPIGAGQSRKAPVDLETGLSLKGWPNKAFSIEELSRPSDYVMGIGYRPGPDSDWIIAVDLDGPQALKLCEEMGCRVEEVGWRTERSNSADRLKVHFRINPEDRKRFAGKDDKPIGKCVLTLPVPEGEDHQLIELFIETGQCIIAGDHPSGGTYVPVGSPETVTEPTEEWWTLIEHILKKGEVEAGREDRHEDGECYHSGPGTPCPICGRDTTSACTIYTDGDRRRVNCHVGQTFAPPEGDGKVWGKTMPLIPGSTITGADGGTWAYTGDGRNPAIGTYKVFVEDRPMREETKQDNKKKRDIGVISYSELLETCLQAIAQNNEDLEMRIRAELQTRFRVPEEKINPKLMILYIRQSVGTKLPDHPSVDMSNIKQLDYLMDGHIPRATIRMLYAPAGTGKTMVEVWIAHNFAQGLNVLDRSTPCEPGNVLFICTDSGPGPLKKAASDLLIDTEAHPNWKPGPDQKIFVWGHAPEQGHVAWIATLNGLLELKEFIATFNVKYVVIDSAKSVVSGVLKYTDNESVKSLLRLLQCCICEPLGCCITFINHDGTEKEAHAGAKAWREDPSVVVKLSREMNQQGQQFGVRMDFIKDRAAVADATRSFVYTLEHGELVLAPEVEVVGTCEEQILQVLWRWHEGTDAAMPIRELKDEMVVHYNTSFKTVENTLPRLVSEKPPRVVRTRRGMYKLAPGEIQRREAEEARKAGVAKGQTGGGLINVSTLRGEEGSDPLQQKGSDIPPTTPRRGEAGVSPPRLALSTKPPTSPAGGTPGGDQTLDAASDLPTFPPTGGSTPIGLPTARPAQHAESDHTTSTPQEPEPASDATITVEAELTASKPDDVEDGFSTNKEGQDGHEPSNNIVTSPIERNFNAIVTDALATIERLDPRKDNPDPAVLDTPCLRRKCLRMGQKGQIYHFRWLMRIDQIKHPNVSLYRLDLLGYISNELSFFYDFFWEAEHRFIREDCVEILKLFCIDQHPVLRDYRTLRHLDDDAYTAEVERRFQAFEGPFCCNQPK